MFRFECNGKVLTVFFIQGKETRQPTAYRVYLPNEHKSLSPAFFRPLTTIRAFKKVLVAYN